MEGLWILIVIFSIISKIMKKSKMAGTNKPQSPKADMDVSAKKFLEQLTENFEEMAQSQKQDQPKKGMFRPSVIQAMGEKARPQVSKPVEGECLEEAHLKQSQEGIGVEGKPAGLEGISTEGAYNKGSMTYKDTRSTMMEGSAHPLAAEVDLRAAGIKAKPKAGSGVAAKKSVWAQRIIWKEILSEPVALRKRHGHR